MFSSLTANAALTTARLQTWLVLWASNYLTEKVSTMTHKEQMTRGILAALDAMPKRMRGCDMAHLFAQFIITYDMEPDTADIAIETAKLVQMYVNECSNEDLQTTSAIRDADQFLAKIQAGDQG